MSIERAQAAARGWLVRSIRSSRIYGQVMWHDGNAFGSGPTRTFDFNYSEFISNAVNGRVRVLTGYGFHVRINAGTVMHLLLNRCILFEHFYDSNRMCITIVRPCEREKRRTIKDFGTSSRGNKRIRPMPEANFKGICPELQAHIVTFMTMRDYWAFSLVSRNVHFNGKSIIPYMHRLATLHLGHPPRLLEKAMRGYTCLRQPNPCEWRTVYTCSVSHKIVATWTTWDYTRQDRDRDCVYFMTSDGTVGKTDLEYGGTQCRRSLTNPYNDVMGFSQFQEHVVLRRLSGFSMLLSAQGYRHWLTVRVPGPGATVHEVAIVCSNVVYFVSGSSRELWYYDVDTRTSLQLPHSRVRMLKPTPLGIICRTATKQLTYHSKQHVGGLNTGISATLPGVGRVAMISDRMPSGCNVVIRARGKEAFQALVMKEMLIVRTVQISWTPWSRREIEVLGDMLTFHCADTHRRLCVRPDTGDWQPKDMCVGTTDGQLLFCNDTTVFVPKGRAICVLPRWA